MTIGSVFITSMSVTLGARTFLAACSEATASAIPNIEGDIACSMKYSGRPLNEGRCFANRGGDNNENLLIYSDSNGCVFTFRDRDDIVEFSVWPYRNKCYWTDNSSTEEIPPLRGSSRIGWMNISQDQDCWRAQQFEFCLDDATISSTQTTSQGSWFVGDWVVWEGSGPSGEARPCYTDAGIRFDRDGNYRDWNSQGVYSYSLSTLIISERETVEEILHDGPFVSETLPDRRDKIEVWDDNTFSSALGVWRRCATDGGTSNRMVTTRGFSPLSEQQLLDHFELCWYYIEDVDEYNDRYVIVYEDSSERFGIASFNGTTVWMNPVSKASETRPFSSMTGRTPRGSAFTFRFDAFGKLPETPSADVDRWSGILTFENADETDSFSATAACMA